MLNIAVSFVTNTNWQAYSGESTLSYTSQMLALTVQNFVSAGTGIAVMLALVRGIVGHEIQTLGNYWSDLFRSIFYVLLPGSVILTLILVSQGSIQNLSGYVDAVGLEGVKQILPMGPAASQTAISVWGSNGGGFFGVNLAHPFINPTEWSNWVLILAILLLPASLVHYYGLQVGSKKEGWVLFGVMAGLLGLFLGPAIWAQQIFGSLEGLETRFGALPSVLMGVVSTATSNGSVNAALESLSPLSSGLMMLQMMLGEVIFGGVGCGLYGILLFVVLTVFIAGLMIGRTPEYLGKKIDAPEVAWALVAILLPCGAILIGSSVSVLLKQPGSLSEILYAFSSSVANNGSAFGGLNSNTPYYNLALAVVMMIGRYGILFPVLVIAGIFARKKKIPVNPMSFETDTALFGVLLASVILLVGALTFTPALFLGPLFDHGVQVSGI
jgi:K+-transporting ATPase ATPase A chain